MRRSRAALTAWPAFADLMTILAVVGLAIAAGLAGSLPSEGSADERVEELEEELASARDVIRELERELVAGRLGSVPCLGTRPGSRTAPVPLLRIVVVVDAGYRLERQWPPESDVGGIPRLDEAVARGSMQEDDLQGYARGMYEYGDADDTYGGPCRFWIELRPGGESTSQTAFARALGVVNQYFLITNSSEVNQILMGMGDR